MSAPDTASPAREIKIDRSRLPEPGPARPFAFPAIEKSTLPNGLRVWTVCHPQVPVIAFDLLVRRGASADPPGKDGLAALTADMLDEGSGDRSAIEMHEALARLGAQFDTDIGSDAASVSVTVLTRFAGRALTLLADVVARPALRDDDFTRVRQLRLHRLTQLRDMPGVVADRAFLKLLYGSHPYGHSPIGNEAALAGMTVDDVRAFHAAAIRPSVATLIAVGECDHDAVVHLATEAFGDWREASGDAVTPDGTVPAAAALNIIPRPKAPQSELRIGHVAVPRDERLGRGTFPRKIRYARFRLFHEYGMTEPAHSHVTLPFSRLCATVRDVSISMPQCAPVMYARYQSGYRIRVTLA